MLPSGVVGVDVDLDLDVDIALVPLEGQVPILGIRVGVGEPCIALEDVQVTVVVGPHLAVVREAVLQARDVEHELGGSRIQGSGVVDLGPCAIQQTLHLDIGRVGRVVVGIGAGGVDVQALAAHPTVVTLEGHEVDAVVEVDLAGPRRDADDEVDGRAVCDEGQAVRAAVEVLGVPVPRDVVLLPVGEVGCVPADVGVARPDVDGVLIPSAVDVRPEAQWAVVHALGATDAVRPGLGLDILPYHVAILVFPVVVDVDVCIDMDVAGRGVIDSQVPGERLVGRPARPLVVGVVGLVPVPLDVPLDGVVVTGWECGDVQRHRVGAVLQVVAIRPDVEGGVGAAGDVEVVVLLVKLVPVPVGGVVDPRGHVDVAVELEDVGLPVYPVVVSGGHVRVVHGEGLGVPAVPV